MRVNRRWTDEEDALLRARKRVPGRTSRACAMRRDVLGCRGVAQVSDLTYVTALAEAATEAGLSFDEVDRQAKPRSLAAKVRHRVWRRLHDEERYTLRSIAIVAKVSETAAYNAIAKLRAAA